MSQQFAPPRSGYQPGGPPKLQPRLWSATQWLMAGNIAIYILDLASKHKLILLGRLDYDQTIAQHQPWRLIAFQFFHASPLHILFNMVLLYFFGPLIEDILGKVRFVGFYLLCGLIGGVVFLAMSKARLLGLKPDSELVGASAGIFGIMGAAARIMPNLRVRLFFFSMRLYGVVLLYVGLSAIIVIIAGDNTGGAVAHLGGAGLGYSLGSAISRVKRTGSSRTKHKFWKPGQTNFLRDDLDA